MATYEPQLQPSAPRPIPHPQAHPYNPPTNSFPPPPQGSYPPHASSSIPAQQYAPPSHAQVSELRAEHGYAPDGGSFGAAPPNVALASSQPNTSSLPGSGPPPGSYPQQQTYQPPVPQAYPAQAQLHPQALFAQPAPQGYVNTGHTSGRARGYSDTSTHSRSSGMSISPRRGPYIPRDQEPSLYPPGSGPMYGATSPSRRGPPPVDASGGVDPHYYEPQYGTRARGGSRGVSDHEFGVPMGRFTSHPEVRHYDDAYDYDEYDDDYDRMRRGHGRRASEGNYGWEDRRERRGYNRRSRSQEERRRKKFAAQAIKEDIERKPTMGDSLMAAIKTVKKAL